VQQKNLTVFKSRYTGNRQVFSAAPCTSMPDDGSYGLNMQFYIKTNIIFIIKAAALAHNL